MIWDLYSIGDSAYLAAILNAVAMVAGTADMRTLAGVGFLLGIILVAFQGILQGAQGIRFQNVLVAWIIYAGLFGTTAKVSIEDAYTGQVRVVDHVPFGPAFVGSTMSLVGYKLTSLFEQAFSTPAMTQGGFADPLQTLATVRKSMLTRAALAKANSPVPGADAEKTYTNYFDECVLRDVDAGARSIESVMSAQTWADFAVASDIWTTQIWTGGIARTLSCSDAWPEVNAFTANLFLPALQTMLQAALRLQNPGDVPGRVQAALDALGGLGQDAQNYMVMSALWPFLEQAKVQTHMNLHEFNAATTVEQAIAQRNGQWAAEASLFARIVRPMMTFFEGFIFAITPLMAFAVALGPTGIMMVGKWLLFGLWIQLWMPVLAIVNLYINLAAQRDMAAIENVELLPLSSFYGIMKSDVLIQDYLGVGGMLAASTPAISLMLIYGSAITATHLAGRLQGGDHIDEKLASPDVAKTGPGLQLLQRMTNEPTTGTVLHGAQGVLPTFSAGQAMERSVSSAEGHQTQAMESFARTLGVAGTKSAERRQATGTDYTQSENWTAGKSQTDGYLKDQAEGLIRQFGLSGKSTDAVGAALAAGITASASGGGEMTVRGAVSRALSASGTVGAGLQGQARGELKTDAGNSAEQVAQLTNAITRRVTSDTGMRAELAEREAHDETVNQTTIFTDGLGRQERAEVSRTANEAVSASRQYQEAQAAAQRVGSETRLTSPQMGLLIAGNSGVMEELKRTVARHGLTGAAERLAAEHRYASSMPNRDQAYAAAAMSLLYGSNQPDSPRTPQETALMQDAGARLFGMVAGGYSGSAIDPHSQQPLTVGAPRSGRGTGCLCRRTPIGCLGRCPFSPRERGHGACTDTEHIGRRARGGRIGRRGEP